MSRERRNMAPVKELHKAAQKLGMKPEHLKPLVVDRQILQGMTWEQAIAAELEARDSQ